MSATSTLLLEKCNSSYQVQPKSVDSLDNNNRKPTKPDHTANNGRKGNKSQPCNCNGYEVQINRQSPDSLIIILFDRINDRTVADVTIHGGHTLLDSSTRLFHVQAIIELALPHQYPHLREVTRQVLPADIPNHALPQGTNDLASIPWVNITLRIATNQDLSTIGKIVSRQLYPIIGSRADFFHREIEHFRKRPATEGIVRKWTMPLQGWAMSASQLKIIFFSTTCLII